MTLLLAEAENGETPGRSLMRTAALEGYAFHTVSTSEELLMFAHEYELVVVGKTLDDMSGLRALWQLRSAGKKMPIIYVSKLDTVKNRVTALRLGADDAVSLPVEPREFTARLFAVLHRERLPKMLQVGDLVFECDRKAAFLMQGNKVRLNLTPKEFDVLEFLAQNKDTVVTRTMLLELLYESPEQEPELKIIDVFICKLRSKLKKNLNWNPIETIWGRGYRLLEEPNSGEDVSLVA